MLEVRAVSVRYGKALALDDLSFGAQSGAVTAIVGPNGAGKSSLLGAIYGAVSADGQVFLEGKDVSGLPAMERAHLGLALVPQGRQLFPHMTVRDNLIVMAQLLGAGNAEVEKALARFPILGERSRQLAGILSGGEQQMLAVARALMGSPRVLLLDEMVAGLAPRIVQDLMAVARQLAATGVSVLLAEPSIGAIRDQIDRGLVLLRGRIVAECEGGAALEQAYQQRMGVIA